MNEADLALLEITKILIIITTTKGLTIEGAKDIAERGLKELVTEKCIIDAIEELKNQTKG